MHHHYLPTHHHLPCRSCRYASSSRTRFPISFWSRYWRTLSCLSRQRSIHPSYFVHFPYPPLSASSCPPRHPRHPHPCLVSNPPHPPASFLVLLIPASFLTLLTPCLVPNPPHPLPRPRRPHPLPRMTPRVHQPRLYGGPRRRAGRKKEVDDA